MSNESCTKTNFTKGKKMIYFCRSILKFARNRPEFNKTEEGKITGPKTVLSFQERGDT